MNLVFNQEIHEGHEVILYCHPEGIYAVVVESVPDNLEDSYRMT
jgi:hypothetical protein